MLTVMHRHNDGTETIYEAQAVTRESTGAAVMPAYGDVLLKGVPEPKDGLYGGPGSCWEGNGVIRLSEKYFTKDGFDGAMVFVMNRHGATVARHRMGPPLAQ